MMATLCIYTYIYKEKVLNFHSIQFTHLFIFSFFSSCCCFNIISGGLQIENSREEDQGKYECVAENSVGTEHSKATNLYVKVRRVSPTFSRPPEPINEVMLGSSLNLSCIAVGSPMPHVKWMKGIII